MRTLLVSSFVLLLTAVGVGGCAADDSADDGSGPASEEELRSLTIKDDGNGKTFTVEKGGNVKLALSSNATTGFKWKVVSTTRTFGYPSPKDGSYQGGGSDGPVGGGGTQLFTWKTNSPLLQPSATAHTVKLEYRRSFEDPSGRAEKTFTFKIKVKQGAEPAPSPGRPITIKEQHDGSTVRAKEGQDVIVRLTENPSAGYRWYVESVDRTIGQPEKTSEGPGANGPVGASATAIFTWKTAGGPSKVGSHLIKLKYSRGESGAASKQFSFTINVVKNDAEDPEELVCPPEGMRTINCMPPTTSPYCKSDFRSFAQENCDVSYLD